MTKPRHAILLALPILAGCSAYEREREAQDAVREILLDPESARFEVLHSSEVAVCGLVNARNRFGGYDGNAPFVFRPETGVVDVFNRDADLDLVAQALDGENPRADQAFAEMEVACRLPADWNQHCGEIPAPVTRPEPLCSLWEDRDGRALARLRDRG